MPRMLRKGAVVFGLIVLVCLPALPAAGEGKVPTSRGQVVYTPVYSHIYIGDRERPFLLAATVSIRNTCRTAPITLESADYYDADGKLLKRYLESPAEVAKLGTIRFVVPESDKSGGSGAKFLITWRAGSAVTEPLVEAVMIGAGGQQGISFTSRGQVIEELP